VDKNVAACGEAAVKDGKTIWECDYRSRWTSATKCSEKVEW